MAEIVLYGPATAPFTVKVERALRLKKLPFRLVEPRAPEDYRRWNRETGLLPLIDVDGERVHDSTRILEWLDELFPEPPLVAADPKVAETQRRLEDWCDETFFFYWLRWSHRRQIEAERPPRVGLRSRLGRMARRRGPAPDPAGAALSPATLELVEQLGRRCDDLVNLLAGRPFFYADRPSLADLAVYAILCNMRRGDLPRGAQLLRERPPLLAFLARVEEATGGAP